LKVWNQVFLCDSKLFNWQIGRNMDDLNSINEWLKHVGNIVRGANKDCLWKIKSKV
jgi:hypothetical protein